MDKYGDDEVEFGNDDANVHNDAVMLMTNMSQLDSVMHPEALLMMSTEQSQLPDPHHHHMHHHHLLLHHPTPHQQRPQHPHPATEGAVASQNALQGGAGRHGAQTLLPPLTSRVPYQDGLLLSADVLPGLLKTSPHVTLDGYVGSGTVGGAAHGGPGGGRGVGGSGNVVGSSPAVEHFGRVSLHAPQAPIRRSTHAALPAEAVCVASSESTTTTMAAPTGRGTERLMQGGVLAAEEPPPTPHLFALADDVAADRAASGADAPAYGGMFPSAAPGYAAGQRPALVVWTSQRYRVPDDCSTTSLTMAPSGLGASEPGADVGWAAGGAAAAAASVAANSGPLLRPTRAGSNVPSQLARPAQSAFSLGDAPSVNTDSCCDEPQQRGEQPAAASSPRQVPSQFPIRRSSSVAPAPGEAMAPAASLLAVARRASDAVGVTSYGASAARDVICAASSHIAGGAAAAATAVPAVERGSGGSAPASAASNVPSSTLAGSTATASPSGISAGRLGSPLSSPTSRPSNDKKLSTSSNAMSPTPKSLGAVGGRSSGSSKAYDSVVADRLASSSTASVAGAAAAAGAPLARWQQAARETGLAASIARGFRTLRDQYAENLVDERQLRVVARLGEGTFARVDKCLYSPSDGAKTFLVAVKRIKEAMLLMDHDPEDVLLFIQEAQLLRKLNHPNIVQYIGIGFITAGSGLIDVNPFEALGQLTAATARQRRRSSVSSDMSARPPVTSPRPHRLPSQQPSQASQQPSSSFAALSASLTIPDASSFASGFETEPSALRQKSGSVMRPGGVPAGGVMKPAMRHGSSSGRPAGPVAEKVDRPAGQPQQHHNHHHHHHHRQQGQGQQGHVGRRNSGGMVAGNGAAAGAVKQGAQTSDGGGGGGLILRGLFIVEEYLAGGSLKDLVRQQMRQPQRQLYSNATALKWMAQVAGALSYMHTCRPKVLHRDIKLDNLLLSSPTAAGPYRNGSGSTNGLGSSGAVGNGKGDPRVATPMDGANIKLSDLGLATLVAHHQPAQGQQQQGRLTGVRDSRAEWELLDFDAAAKEIASGLRQPSEASRLVRQRVQAATHAPPHLRPAAEDEEELSRMLDSHASGRLGTYMYMAPEVQRRQKYDEKCDCFSFAVVMYEVFHRYILVCSLEAPEQMEDYARQVAHGFRPAIHDDLPPELRRLIRECWAQEPAARPDMASVASQLQSMMASGVVAGLDRRQQAAGGCGCGGCVIS
ncbi:hypothetical protein Agub_g880 [Astrephomene gubernaculifera]|uniref:Protein kinase domain-containing protein n=1 Tax=Astrephomene gubernaculifera TaxID=47775 RepID=A0AAD3HH13_9CHLO|nr:hypothetical protein Agub_g880 [Astrephomene gubernaculifera]